MCGGTLRRRRPGNALPGLSPRVRGNPALFAPEKLAERSIPACAGEPSYPSPSCRSRTVYPRVCGGTKASIGRLTSPSGLSPRVRGNPARRRQRDRRPRSIPACAGEPAHGLQMARIRRVYPRVCGGTRPRPAGRECENGLSPRVRGNLSATILSLTTYGSIPACAGEPAMAASLR